MNEVFRNIDWTQAIYTIWTVVLLPIITSECSGCSKRCV